VPLRYLFDENLRGLLWRHDQRHNVRGIDPIDVARIGDPGALPLGSLDPEILRWAEQANRILVSRDERTLGTHLADHLASGGRCPGIFLVRVVPLATIVEFLACAAYASEGAEWENQITFIP
jgi:hypothetical protein